MNELVNEWVLNDGSEFCVEILSCLLEGVASGFLWDLNKQYFGCKTEIFYWSPLHIQTRYHMPRFIMVT